VNRLLKHYTIDTEAKFGLPSLVMNPLGRSLIASFMNKNIGLYMHALGKEYFNSCMQSEQRVKGYINSPNFCFFERWLPLAYLF
jgi:hypothetical protein